MPGWSHAEYLYIILELAKTFSKYQTLERNVIGGLKRNVEVEGESLLAVALTNIPAVGRNNSIEKF